MTGPEPEEIARHLAGNLGVPPMVAQQIAFLCGGNVRAAEIDARAWSNEHRPAAPAAKQRAKQTGFALA